MGDGGHFDDDLYIIRPGLDDSGSQCHLEMSIYLVRWMDVYDLYMHVWEAIISIYN